jgi:membrane-associated phospholipid phosphatase
MTPRQWQRFGVAAGTALGLLVTVDFLAGGPISALDQGIYDRIGAWEESGLPVHWWAEALTKVAAPAYATAITVAVVAWWWLTGHRRLAYWGAGASAASAVLITLLKQGFQRELPPVAAGAWYGYSFPSGHTIGAAAALGLLVLLGAQRRIDRLQLHGPAARRTWAVAVVAWALLTLVVGVGRILTQRHWASDVLASWGIGTALACGTLLLARIPSSPAPAPEASKPAPPGIRRAA